MKYFFSTGFETGYYGRPGYAGGTFVHIVRMEKPVCRYRPAKSMKFQWCAHGIVPEYLECSGCKQWLKEKEGGSAWMN